MSKQASAPRRTLPTLMAQKGSAPIVVLTAYTTPMAALYDAHVDMLLVGDSLGMVLYGFDSTLPVTLEMMIQHTKAVMRGSCRAAVICDMPFGSYQASLPQAFVNASRIMKETGCAGVKIEGGREMAPTVRMLAERGIPVMSHIGLMPQHVHRLGGYKTQGRTETDRKKIMDDALASVEAGAFALLLEGIEEPLAREITTRVSVPTIGIGASPACDGQVLVAEDMLGLFERTPKFVQQFADLRGEVSKGVKAYAQAVRERTFPSAEHLSGMKKDLH